MSILVARRRAIAHETSSKGELAPEMWRVPDIAVPAAGALAFFAL